MQINFYKSSTTGLFILDDKIVPAGSFSMNIQGGGSIQFYRPDGSTVFEQSILIEDVLDESGDSYASISALITAVADFFVKASGGGGSTIELSTSLTETVPGKALDATVGKTLNDILITALKDGSSAVYVKGEGSNIQNAAELQAVYNAAKTMSPALGNKITVIIAPGKYEFGATAFVHDAPYIDLVSLTGEADVFIGSTEENTEYDYIYGIKVTADNTLLKGVNCGSNTFYIADSLDYLTCTNCIGGYLSFGSEGTVSGTFNNCIGGLCTFGSYGTASGTFNNCTGGDYSFGSSGTASGIFINCKGGDYSFGCGNTASGTFKDCTGYYGSFGGDAGYASGTFNNCTGGDYSFGSGGTADGTFNNCTGGDTSFGSNGTASGVFSSCIGGDDSFGAYGACSGILANCIGGSGAFGSFGNALGTFNNCIGGTQSFGSSGEITATARLYYCKSGSTFPTPTAGGRIIYCIDGTNAAVNI
jgi:hypothetical protein